jgi:hypothetical protein
MPTAAPGRSVIVGMGQTVPIDLLQSPARTWAVRNLRSYQTEYCDDYWNFAWYLAWSSPAL